MKIQETHLEGCFLITPQLYEDERGYFFESYNEKLFNKAAGYNVKFVQDNQSFSNYGVLRGLHGQKGEFAQAKLVRVLRGEILDVAVDMRPGSKTYGEHFKVKLSDVNKMQLFIPRGFLHGFVVLSECAEFLYKCDNFYNKESEYGAPYNDPSLSIDWGVSEKDIILSKKDSYVGYKSK